MVAFGKPIGSGWFERQARAHLDPVQGPRIVRGTFVRMSAFEAARHNILGLATREWIDELARDFPEQYEPRVQGIPRRLS